MNELVIAVGTFIEHRNEHPHPFTWPKDADEILGKIRRAKPNKRALASH